MMFKLDIIGSSQKDISMLGELAVICSGARYLIIGVTRGDEFMNIGPTVIWSTMYMSHKDGLPLKD